MDEEMEQEAGVENDDAASDPPRLPPMGGMGNYGGLPPLHTLPYGIETNVSRIATQIALGRRATYD